MRIEKNMPMTRPDSPKPDDQVKEKKGIKLPEGVIHHTGPVRQGQEHISEKELRQKIASKAIESGGPFIRPKSNRPPFPLADAPDDQKEMALKNPDKVLTDVGLNNPNDPTTTEKLKSVLGSGTFPFNSNERNVLEKIIS
jgi:hypothetical protein